jgi:glycine/D-amino acid oxidase-like deaminating enzyme
MLKRLRAAFATAGGRVLAEEVTAAGRGGSVLRSGRVLKSDWTVVATGHSEGVLLAPELNVLTPIKGQILRFDAHVAPEGGPTVRGEGIYVAPSRLGPAVGATMEAGRSDRRFEPAEGERLRQAAGRLFPHLLVAPAVGQAGVRAATPDGRPLIGRSAQEGVFLLTGARRNGWLLAALAARMTVAMLAAEDPGVWAPPCRPDRFGEAS